MTTTNRVEILIQDHPSPVYGLLWNVFLKLITAVSIFTSDKSGHASSSAQNVYTVPTTGKITMTLITIRYIPN